jgi:hypothetical protein
MWSNLEMGYMDWKKKKRKKFGVYVKSLNNFLKNRHGSFQGVNISYGLAVF